MAGQNIQYVVGANVGNLVSNLRQGESAAMSLEKSLTGVSSAVKDIAAMAGVGLGVGALVEAGKSVVDTAAKFEQFRFMIKIASHDSADFAANLAEVKHVVNDLNAPIEEANKSWGKLLASVKDTKMEGAPIRGMFEDLSKVMAVMPITKDEKGRAFYAIREMFEEQVIQTRHFVRQLSIAIPGILPMAEHLTGTTGAQFKKMLREKDPNKQIDPSTFLPELFRGLAEKFATTANLTEQMGNMATQVTRTKNAWIEFEDELGIKAKPQIIQLTSALQGSVAFLRDHEQAIINTVEGLVKVGGAWLAYKTTMGLVNGANALFISGAAARTESIVSQTAATGGLNAELALMNTNLEILVELQAAASTGALNIASINAGAMGLPISTPMPNAAGMGAGIASTIKGGAMIVGLSWVSLEAMEALNNVFSKKTGDEGYGFKWTDMLTDPNYDKAKRAGASEANHETLQKLIDEHIYGLVAFGNGTYRDITGFNKKNSGSPFSATGNDLFELIDQLNNVNKARGDNKFDLVKSLVGYDNFGKLKEHTNAALYDKLKGLGYNLGYLAGGGAGSGAGSGAGGLKYGAPVDHVTGQRVTNVHITINGGVNGMKVEKQTINDAKELGSIEEFTSELGRALQSVVHDSQLGLDD